MHNVDNGLLKSVTVLSVFPILLVLKLNYQFLKHIILLTVSVFVNVTFVITAVSIIV